MPAKYEYTHSGNVKTKPYQWKVDDKADSKSVIEPGAVANTSYCMTGQMETVDVTKMLAVHKFHMKKVKDEAYKKKGAVPETITHNDTPNYDIQSQMGAEDVPTADSEKKESNVQENPSSIDEPRAVNNYKQTNGVADKKEPRGSP